MGRVGIYGPGRTELSILHNLDLGRSANGFASPSLKYWSCGSERATLEWRSKHERITKGNQGVEFPSGRRIDCRQSVHGSCRSMRQLGLRQAPRHDPEASY